MLNNDTSNSNNNSLVIWVKEKSNTTLKVISIGLEGKEKVLISVVFCIVALISVNLTYKTFNENKAKEMFSELKPSIPNLPTTKANSKANSNNKINNNVKESDSKSMLEVKDVNDKSLIKVQWQAIDSLLASNDKRRETLFRKLKLSNDEYIIACVIVSCGDCDEIALALNKKANLGQIIAITNGSIEQANDWKRRLKLNFRVESVSNELFDDSGVVILPTLIRVKNLKATGVSEDPNVIN